MLSKQFYVVSIKFTFNVLIPSFRNIEKKADCDVKVNDDLISYMYEVLKKDL